MKKNGRLSLSDFKLAKVDSKHEIDKLLGGVAAACHTTCNKMEGADYIDFLDHEGEKEQILPLDKELLNRMLDPRYDWAADDNAVLLK